MNPHGLFCPCDVCDKMWAELEEHHSGDIETYDYEYEKELDQLYELGGS